MAKTMVVSSAPDNKAGGSPQALLTVVAQLAKLSELSGVFVGEVIEDAWVTEGDELVCRITTKQFPENEDGSGGLTAKVALDWLTDRGWPSLLPRKGQQVYFIFSHGHGGQD